MMLWDVQHGQDDDEVRILTRTPKIWIILQQIHRLLLPITLTSKCLGKSRCSYWRNVASGLLTSANVGN